MSERHSGIEGPQLERRVDKLEWIVQEHIKDCGKRQVQILDAFKDSKIERNALKHRMDMALIALVTILIGVVGVLLKSKLDL